MYVCVVLYFSFSFWLVENFSTKYRMREAFANQKDLECCAFLQMIIKLPKSYFHPRFAVCLQILLPTDEVNQAKLCMSGNVTRSNI